MSVINTNILSLVAQNNLTKSQSALSSAIGRLSSGLRINSAKDDAAGQAIANRFTASITGLTTAQRNANDGISLAQTTEGALNEINNNLQRVRELTVQAANGSNSAADKASIQAEITQRLGEIDRTSAQTDFNGVKVLSSSAKTLSVQVGANDGETISIGLSEISSKTLGLTGFNVDGTGSPNKGAASTDLLIAGFAAGATTNGVTAYSRTLTAAANGATSDNALAAIQDKGTVAVGTQTYTYNAANQSYSVADSARTLANTNASLTPPAGGSVTATVTIGGKSTNVNIDSKGALTDASDGSALYLDATKNLTKTGTASVAATVTNLTAAATGMQSGDTIKIGATGATYTSAGANFTVAGEAASSTAVAADLKTNGGTVDVDGTGATTYTATAGGALTGAFIGASGLTKTALETVNLNSNGVVTDASANVVYTDTANPGKLTTKTVSNATVTVDPLKALDEALSKVDKLRGSLGAVQNRFDSVISNLGSTITNLSSSRSRIQDADYATEVSNMTRAQILQQAGTSVLAKANQSTQGVLSLLQ
ncbi:flagellin [Collimonas sp. OK607]|uniref:flagellin N-terminal helical domain-containing protein n=1 Tax=Collimonas sp. OK607 TaxID=1798194 RepID=UPI0008DF3B24|nr:flagellin [Collimonas sp. OK607]SFB22441.1 flagellin [Collimonas sp. OK607]